MKKLDKIKEKLDKIVNSSLFNKICFIVAILIMGLYFSLYMLKQPIVDEEVRPEITNNLIPWEVKNGDNFFKAMLTRPFNLNITEMGQYRPRYLAFLVQFLDENLFLKITRLISSFGNRQPFYILSMFLFVGTMYYFIKSIWKKCPNGCVLLISSMLLMFQNYQVATYWRARSAKLLALSACIFLITYVINNLNIKFEKKNLKKLFLSIPIFLLMTLDEQVLAIGALLFGLAIIFSIINKKINLSTAIMSVSCFLYGSFHLWWGKALFRHFTGGLQRHGHTIGGSISGISFKTFDESFEILKTTIPKVIFMSFVVFALVWIYCFIKISFNKTLEKKEKIKKLTIALFLTLSSFILLMLMIDAHNAIYTLPCLWKSVYPLISTIILFMSLIYLLANTEFKYNFIRYIIIFVGLSISFVYNLLHITNYYGAYLVEKGGFMGEYTDLIVTKNDIRTKAIESKNVNIDNIDYLANLNTIFSTSNFKTTKTLYGMHSDKKHIDDDYACYLVVKNNRKLVVKLSINDYIKFDSLKIYINNDEVKNVPIKSEKIDENIDIFTEINRASKVRLKFNRKKNVKIDKNDIKIEKLYMR